MVMKRQKYFPSRSSEGKKKKWLMYNELRYRFGEAEGTMIHYLLFEAEAIPSKILKTETILLAEYEANNTHKFFDKFSFPFAF